MTEDLNREEKSSVENVNQVLIKKENWKFDLFKEFLFIVKEFHIQQVDMTVVNLLHMCKIFEV